jgi:HSP20 family molecular chaperone IbpA
MASEVTQFSVRNHAPTNAIAQRTFGLFQQRGGADGRDLEDWFRAESELLKPVPIEISESNDTYTIRAEVPRL